MGCCHNYVWFNFDVTFSAVHAVMDFKVCRFIQLDTFFQPWYKVSLLCSLEIPVSTCNMTILFKCNITIYTSNNNDCFVYSSGIRHLMALKALSQHFVH